METKCKRCGESFSCKPSELSWRRYCSRECKEADNRSELTCQHCGKTYSRLKSQIPKAGSRFCSTVCKNEGMRTVEKKPMREPRVQNYAICQECGIAFPVPPSRMEKAKYCSKKCKLKSPEFKERCSAAQRGEKSWRVKRPPEEKSTGTYKWVKSQDGHKHAVQRIVMREWMLEECPDHPFLVGPNKELAKAISVHHIDRNRENNSRDNLLAVTSSAHIKIHHNGRKPEPWECWPPNPERW